MKDVPSLFQAAVAKATMDSVLQMPRASVFCVLSSPCILPLENAPSSVGGISQILFDAVDSFVVS